jgi:hypothetical protein
MRLTVFTKPLLRTKVTIIGNSIHILLEVLNACFVRPGYDLVMSSSLLTYLYADQTSISTLQSIYRKSAYITIRPITYRLSYLYTGNARCLPVIIRE